MSRYPIIELTQWSLPSGAKFRICREDPGDGRPWLILQGWSPNAAPEWFDLRKEREFVLQRILDLEAQIAQLRARSNAATFEVGERVTYRQEGELIGRLGTVTHSAFDNYHTWIHLDNESEEIRVETCRLTHTEQENGE